MKEHLPYKTIFCSPVGWSLITSFTIKYVNHVKSNKQLECPPCQYHHVRMKENS